MTSTKLDEIFSSIEQKSSELSECGKTPSHWSFDVRSHPGTPVEIVVIGCNPGESAALAADWDGRTIREESSRSNFQHALSGRALAASRSWSTRLSKITGGRSVAYTNVFLWSSRDRKKHFKLRYGSDLEKQDQLLKFCADANQKLLALHKPRLVIVAGLGLLKVMEEHYKLKASDSDSGGGRRTVVELQGGEQAWIAIPHPTGARPSSARLEEIASFVDGRFSQA
ncbi:hypothetical protein PQS31_14365 [Luteimonas sp BLCC-B24]|uniref:hypothetical protein n=1 Tax=Luteimonas sp. BLCC-B24 TaxID=3025317 RepID=UPI00234E2038|nr:hypothetical protein [Luteimonas sp. BLCC-B24]MDC7807995.1 hypothetical protein [Luteimonas sp. BLCC-B24]